MIRAGKRQKRGVMSENNIVDDAISKMNDMGARAGDAIKDFKDSEAAEKLADGIKRGAKTAAEGVKKGAKIAADGIAAGTKIASQTIKNNAEANAKKRASRKGTPFDQQSAYRTPDEDGKMVFRLRNGVAIPAVGYGSYLATEKDGKQVILDALNEGYRYIDTAAFYKNESEIGEAIKESGIGREELFICSKVWPTMLGAEKLKESFEKSCSDLGVEYLNMFLIHWPKVSQKDEDWIPKLQESWAVMEDMYREGKVRAIGLSNFLPHHIRPLLETARIKPMLDQLELHVGYMQEFALKYLKQEKIMAQAWSPLGRAAMLEDQRIKELAEKYVKSPAQILLRYLIQRGIPAIPKASTPERMRENLDIFDFSLTENEISYLSCITQEGWSGEHPDIMEWGQD